MGKFWFLGGKRGIKIYVLGELKSPGIKSHTHKNIPSPFYLHTQEQMCTSLQWVFLNTNKKAARQGHGPKLKSHFPASDTAISTLTLTLAPQLWWNSHYGLGKEIVPGWEVNYVTWHKNVEKANSTCFSLGKRFFFVQISPCYLVKSLPTCPIYILLWIWFKFCILHTLGFS